MDLMNIAGGCKRLMMGMCGAFAMGGRHSGDARIGLSRRDVMGRLIVFRRCAR